MTENEIKEFVAEIRQKSEIFRNSGFATTGITNVFDKSADIIEELLPYMAIGTVDEFKAYKQGNCTNNCKHYDSSIEYVRNKAIDEFTHQLKETLNQEFPSNYESTRPYFSLENARLIIDDVAEQMKAGGIDG